MDSHCKESVNISVIIKSNKYPLRKIGHLDLSNIVSSMLWIAHLTLENSKIVDDFYIESKDVKQQTVFQYKSRW